MSRVCASILGLCLLASTGCIYMNVVQPLDTDLATTKLGSKVGQSQAQSILGLVAWGDAGTQAAAKDAGITTLNHADTRIFSILGFVYTRQTTIVYGD
jgi:hypothetical protein